MFADDQVRRTRILTRVTTEPVTAKAGLPQRSRVLLLAGEQFEQAVGAVVAEEELVVPVGVGGKLRAPGKEGLLVPGQRGFNVAGVGGDGFAEFGAVEHGEVGALPGKR